MIFRQLLRSESGCASYLIGCGRSNRALVVDPLADLGADVYALEAADQGLRLTYVIDTHVHADHRSAAQELAHVTGAVLALPAHAPAAYAFHPLHDGDIIEVGAVRLQVLHTPGHTPESICLLGADTRRSEQPWFLLSGDTLFSGDVGRPDLLLDDADAQAHIVEQAEQLYDSLFGRLLTLEDLIEVYPGHFGGSACGGVNMSGKPTTTIGFERRWNLALQRQDRQAFVDFVLETLRPQPENYRQIKRENVQPWPGARQPHPGLAALRPADAARLRASGALLLDVRLADDFAAAHPPGAVSVPFSRAELTANLTKLVPLKTALIMLADNDIVAGAAYDLLRADGWTVEGFLAGGMAAWRAARQEVAVLDRWPLERLSAQLGNQPITVVDVREPHEWAQGVIRGARRIPQHELWARRGELPADQQIVTICEGGVRSARAASLLSYLGFPHVATVDGAGMGEWVKRGYPIATGDGE